MLLSTVLRGGPHCAACQSLTARLAGSNDRMWLQLLRLRTAQNRHCHQQQSLLTSMLDCHLTGCSCPGYCQCCCRSNSCAPWLDDRCSLPCVCRSCAEKQLRVLREHAPGTHKHSAAKNITQPQVCLQVLIQQQQQQSGLARQSAWSLTSSGRQLLKPAGNAKGSSRPGAKSSKHAS